MCMEIVFILLYICLFVSSLLFYPFLKKERKVITNKAKLPPGSMGWPYIGESLQLYSQDPNVYFVTKQKRYGEIFKSHILGCPCVMLASPEAAKFVLVTHAHLFKPTYPKSKEKMIGPSALFFHQGDYYNHLRKLVQSSLSPDSIRKQIPDIESIAISAMESWAGGHLINTYQEMKKFSFDVGILSIFGHLDSNYREMLNENYNIIEKGYNSFPTNIPGTSYHKALLAEQMAIHQLNDGGKSPLTWAQTRNMPLTYRVILESLRMASIISFTFREAVVDVEYKGYRIPKGWKVMPLFRNIHHDPDFFSDPNIFDPHRFEVAPKPNTFMPFGNGAHSCPGNELAKLEMLVLIHHLVTKFRWEVAGSQDGIQYRPFPVPVQGLPARFFKESSSLI